MLYLKHVVCLNAKAKVCGQKPFFFFFFAPDYLEPNLPRGRRQWHPTPVLLPGKSHGRRSLVDCSPWGRQESDMTERLHFHFSLSCIGGGNGNSLQCSCLENPRDRGAWWAAVYGVAQSWTRLKRLSSSSSSSSSNLPRRQMSSMTGTIFLWGEGIMQCVSHFSDGGSTTQIRQGNGARQTTTSPPFSRLKAPVRGLKLPAPLAAPLLKKKLIIIGQISQS